MPTGSAGESRSPGKGSSTGSRRPTSRSASASSTSPTSPGTSSATSERPRGTTPPGREPDSPTGRAQQAAGTPSLFSGTAGESYGGRPLLRSSWPGPGQRRRPGVEGSSHSPHPPVQLVGGPRAEVRVTVLGHPERPPPAEMDQGTDQGQIERPLVHPGPLDASVVGYHVVVGPPDPVPVLAEVPPEVHLGRAPAGERPPAEHDDPAGRQAEVGELQIALHERPFLSFQLAGQRRRAFHQPQHGIGDVAGNDLGEALPAAREPAGVGVCVSLTRSGVETEQPVVVREAAEARDR